TRRTCRATPRPPGYQRRKMRGFIASLTPQSFVGYDRQVNIPTVVEQTHRGERSWDIFSRLLKDRIIIIGSEIDDDVTSIVIAQLLVLESEDPDKDVMIYINSSGGLVSAGLAIYDAMEYVQPDVATFCMGEATSMAALILAAGAKGKRYA